MRIISNLLISLAILSLSLLSFADEPKPLQTDHLQAKASDVLKANCRNFKFQDFSLERKNDRVRADITVMCTARNEDAAHDLENMGVRMLPDLYRIAKEGKCDEPQVTFTRTDNQLTVHAVGSCPDDEEIVGPARDKAINYVMQMFSKDKKPIKN